MGSRFKQITFDLIAHVNGLAILPKLKKYLLNNVFGRIAVVNKIIGQVAQSRMMLAEYAFKI